MMTETTFHSKQNPAARRVKRATTIMLELFIYKKEGSWPIEISERQFELIDRTNAKETTVIRSKHGIRTNTAVFKDGKIVNIEREHLYEALDGGFFADENGYSLDVEDIPEIEAYCLERFFGSDQFFTIVIVERLEQQQQGA